MENAAKLVDAEAISYRKGNAVIDDDYLSSSKINACKLLRKKT